MNELLDGQVGHLPLPDSKTVRLQTRTLPGVAFLRLPLHHVLPRRLRRARNYSFLHPNSKRLIALVQVLLKADICAATAWLKPRPAFTCAHCGGAMKVIRTRLPPTPLRGNSPPAGASGCTVM